MELLIALVVLVLFDIAAWYWGADTREGFDERPLATDRPRRSI